MWKESSVNFVLEMCLGVVVRGQCHLHLACQGEVLLGAVASWGVYFQVARIPRLPRPDRRLLKNAARSPCAGVLLKISSDAR